MGFERSAGVVSLPVGVGYCQEHAREAGQAHHIRSDDRICERCNEWHRSGFAPGGERARAVSVQAGATSDYKNSNRMRPRRSTPSTTAPEANI